ncbi:MAG: prepilin-type N-terminal cleavage/methylation domain-containing protein [Lachnospiraceae bacterium]|nr:prepilin-type N-terminal cleavage/methylation domain-containing protein [Lachnospiraceae bacterium]
MMERRSRETNQVWAQKHRKSKALNNQGFTLVEMVIVVGILSVLIALAAIGINGYYESAKQMKRTEVAETAFYSIQSHVNYLKRHDLLEPFNQELEDYYHLNDSGSFRVLRDEEKNNKEKNKLLITTNYEGAGDADSFYNNEYEPAHKGSKIIYLTLDGTDADRKANPLYDILWNGLRDEEAIGNSFLVEYDMTRGVVRSVFYSEYVDSLGFDFANLDGAKEDKADCIWRASGYLSQKQQGYYGLVFTSREYTELIDVIKGPENVVLVNEDWLYLKWNESNTEVPEFIDGTYDVSNLYYTIHLYRTNGVVTDEIATYEFLQGDIYEEQSNPSPEGALSRIDDSVTGVENGKSVILTDAIGGVKKARIGMADITGAGSMSGKDELEYFLLLECLDHRFDAADSGYALKPDDVLSATVEVTYKDPAGRLANVESKDSENQESAYFAYVEKDGVDEVGISFSRHLQNIKNGDYEGDYKLIANIDWADIENRGKTFDFEPIVFADETPGILHGLAGSFNGRLTGDDLVNFADRSYYDCYEIQNLKINAPNDALVGLFATNNGEIKNVILRNPAVVGSSMVGTIVGSNQGTDSKAAKLSKICVLNASVTAKEQAGGLAGANSGTGALIENCSVTTGANRILAWRELGGAVGVSEGTLTNISVAANVWAALPEESLNISSENIGKWIGGVIGRGAAGSKATKLVNGVRLDAYGIPKELFGTDGQRADAALEEIVPSSVVGIASVGGIVGSLDANAGSYKHLYNYATLQALHISDSERSARGNVYVNLHLAYGGIAGSIAQNASVENCVNFTEVSISLAVADNEGNLTAMSAAEEKALSLQNAKYHPQKIGGIAGLNDGLVKDCASRFASYGTLAQEAEIQLKRLTGEEDYYYFGYYVGGLVGSQEKGELLFTSDADEKEMQVSVRGYHNVGGLVGQQLEGAIGCFNEDADAIVVKGTVAGARNTNNAVSLHDTTLRYGSVGGVMGYCVGGVLDGAYTNESNVFGVGAGGIIGFLQNDMTLENCANTGNVMALGFNTMVGSYVGGIVGTNFGTVRECANSGTVSTYIADGVVDDWATAKTYVMYVGGIVGWNYGIVEDCHSRLNAEKTNYLAGNGLSMVGGLVGKNENNAGVNLALIKNSAEEEVIDIPIVIGKSNVTQPSSIYGTFPQAGGVVGSSPVVTDSTSTSTFYLDHFTYTGHIEVRAVSNVMSAYIRGIGGIAGTWYDGEVMRYCKMTGSIDSAVSNTGGLVGYQESGIIDATNEVAPGVVIKGTTQVGGIVGRFHAVYADKAKRADMQVKTNYATVTGTERVGGFFGEFKGGHIEFNDRINEGTITGSGSYVGGLVGYYTAGSSTDAPTYKGFQNCTNKGTVTGLSNVGGLVGYYAPYSTQVSYRPSETLTISDCKNLATVTQKGGNGSNIGGIIGYALNLTLSVSNCTNSGDVVLADETAQSYNVGGIFGWVNYTVTISGCNNEGTIRGNDRTGGIAGMLSSTGTVTNSHNNGAVSGGKNVGGIIGNVGTANGQAVKLTMSGCTNKTGGKIVASDSCAGGIIGYARVGAQTATTAPLSLTSCTNQATVDAPHELGGIAGYIYLTRYTITSCNNTGNLGSSNRWEIYNAGGIVGYGQISAGTVESKITSCTNRGSLLHLSAAADTAAAGGIMGKTNQTIAIDKCTSGSTLAGATGDVNKYTLSADAATSAVGGIIGWIEDAKSTGTAVKVTLTGCKNYMKISAGGNLGYAGGLIGRVDKMPVVLGSATASYLNNASYYCVNYGMITSNGAMTNSGGLVGMADGGTSLALYGARNIPASSVNSATYTLALEAAGMSNVGGLIGHVNNVGTLTLTGVSGVNDNQRTIRSTGNVENIGGILGNMQNVTTVKLTELANTGTFTYNGSVTRHGGIVGHINNVKDAVLSNTDQNNTAGVKTTGYNNVAQSGGIVGSVTNSVVTLGTEGNAASACDNIGALDTTMGLVSNSGGIVGYVTGASSAVTVNQSSNSGKIYSFGFGSKNGGIIGTVEGAASAEAVNCANSGEVGGEGTAEKYGGIVGNADGAGAIAVKGSTNTGKIYCKGASYDCKFGGVVGYANNTVSLSVVSSVNRGEVTSGNYGGQLGGVLGYANNVTTLSLDGAENYYALGQSLNSIRQSGGIIGVVNSSSGTDRTTKLANCVQHGSILHAEYEVGGVVGRHEGIGMTLDSCINGSATDTAEGKIDIVVDQGHNIGGLIGYTRTKTKADGTMSEDRLTNCYNYGTVYASSDAVNRVYHIGALVGFVNANVVMGDADDRTKQCGNLGAINGISKIALEHVGGAIGHAETSTIKLYDFVNEGIFGQNVTRMNSSGGVLGFVDRCWIDLYRCNQLGQIYKAKEGVGGLVGYHIGYNLRMDECNNGDPLDASKGTISMAASASEKIGGLIGDSEYNINPDGTHSVEVLTRSNNYGMITGIAGTGSTNRVGGIIGVCVSSFTAGDPNDPTMGCANYGTIDGPNNLNIANAGGLMGHFWGRNDPEEVQIYDFVNEGVIAQNAARAAFVGGVVGNAEGANVLIVRSAQKAPIYHAVENVGGIVGYFARHTLKVEDSVNEGLLSSTSSMFRNGGILGYSERGVSTTLTSCTNNGKLEMATTATWIGGVAGAIENGTEAAIIDCTNNSDVMFWQAANSIGGILGRLKIPTAAIVRAENNGAVGKTGGTNGEGDGLGGILGYADANGFLSHIQIEDCVNRGTLNARASYQGGIMGHLFSSVAESELEIVGCDNYGTINYGRDRTGGIFSGQTEHLGAVFLANCVNYAEVNATGTFAGGIAGTIYSSAGMIHCINAGNVNAQNRIGGLVGSVVSPRSPYIVDCYQFGTVTGNIANQMIQLVDGGPLNYIDNYYYGTQTNLLGEGQNRGDFYKVWQAKDDALNYGYFSQNVYNQLCDKFGVERNWQNGGVDAMVANAKYLIEHYQYTPTEPRTNSFVFDESNNTLSWKITANNYIAVDGMELALYPVDMDAAEIEADNNNEKAEIILYAGFAGSRIPDSASVTVQTGQLPEERTEYQIVVRNIGATFIAMDDETRVVSYVGNSNRVVTGQRITLPERPLEALTLHMLWSLPDIEELEELLDEEVSGGDAAVSDGNMEKE